ncbi:short transient receptor potential channel 2-like [Crotalus adamanteus]|uniref:Short transient receptor potential channel 2-like n=1 Tax=Crotalus adamanteus TaxID=8729 RepID=A0AAW1BKU2_CROAD
MAPLKIRCVVSFSSQDPRYPVENLLLEERLQPWLCCPSDHSRQLRAELQLEQAGCIGYIDVGNSGSAFLQIEVGRSSWPPGRDYLTLLPTATLMMPADAKLDQNRSSVRMFKEGDLLPSALAEKWDRVRVTCSQPFNRHAQFGLAFLRIRTPQDTEGSPGEPAAPSPSQASPGSSPKPGVFSGAFGGSLSPAEPTSGPEEETVLKNQLQRLDSTLLGKGLGPAGLSRPAQLVLKAAASARKRAPALPTGSPPPAARAREAGQAPRAPGPKDEPQAGNGRLKTRRRPGSQRSARRRPRNGSRRDGGAHSQRGNPPAWESDEEEEEEEEEGESRGGEGGATMGTCPICAGRFPAEVLPVHASACGEAASPSAGRGSWVECPICQDPFPASEVEAHASRCGEEYP